MNTRIFRSKLPVLRSSQGELPPGTMRPQLDPFFYISQGQRLRLTPAMLPPRGLPRAVHHSRSCRELPLPDSAGSRGLNRYRSLERIIISDVSPRALQPLPPTRKRRFILKKVPKPAEPELLTPTFAKRTVHSAQSHGLSAAPQQEQGGLLHLPQGLKLAHHTFRKGW